MNRNHQSQNNHSHTGSGRNNAARRHMGKSLRIPMDYNYRSDGPGPIEIEARDKYPNNHDQNRSYEGIGPKGYKRADRSIEEDVCEMLMQDRYVDAENITVAVENAVVKLAGTVKNRRDKFQIEEIAERASGVDDIVNDIRVVKN